MTGEGATAMGSTVGVKNSRGGDHPGDFKRMSASSRTPLRLILELGLRDYACSSPLVRIILQKSLSQVQ